MIYRIVQFLAFMAVIAAFVISGGSGNNPAKIEPDNFADSSKEKSAVSLAVNVPHALPAFLVSEPEEILTPEGNRSPDQGVGKTITSIPVKEEVLEEPEKISAAQLPEPAPIQESADSRYQAISSNDLSEGQIKLQSIALIKCSFQSQYYDSSSQPWNERRFNLGTGIVISPEGLILTTRHLFEVSEDLLDDPTGRIWSRKKCEAALTDSDVSPISAITTAGKPEDARFQDAEIIFMPSDADYINAKGFDLAVLKIKSDGEIPYNNLFPYLTQFNEKDPVILIGYPGRDSLVSQQLERFDGQFEITTYYKESLCGVDGKPCGLRYVLRRYPGDYEKNFWKKTDLGVITPYFRGGFSGAPAFYKGNLIGIATHGISGEDSQDGWDQAVILTSWDISELLKQNNVVL